MNMVYISDIVEYRIMKESLIQLVETSSETFMQSSVKKYTFVDHLLREHIAYGFNDYSEHSAVKFHNIMPDHALLSQTEKYNHLLKSIAYLKMYGGVLIFMSGESHNMSQIREYGIGAQIIKYLGIKKIELLSESEMKEFVGINGFELEIVNHIKL